MKSKKIIVMDVLGRRSVRWETTNSLDKDKRKFKLCDWKSFTKKFKNKTSKIRMNKKCSAHNKQVCKAPDA